MVLNIHRNLGNEDISKKYDIGFQRDRKMLIGIPFLHAAIRYLLERIPGQIGLIVKEHLFVSSLTLTFIIFMIGMLIVKIKFEFCINEEYVEYTLKDGHIGKPIKLEATDIINPIGIIRFKEIKDIVLNKEEKTICIFLKCECNVFYQWYKVETEQLEEIYTNLIYGMDRLV